MIYSPAWLMDSRQRDRRRKGTVNSSIQETGSFGQAEPLKPVPAPVPRGIDRAQLVNTEYQSRNRQRAT
ncbi:hypothetical protein E2C01_004530 [Portunus trituberculatus]|uniref:Uncharacterized protein n=1 Tax=Portunus trituberculatus TaxID=210409 RepID=A0A5B7CRL8_PORTR|nr:hypothetical protein [Portunus trituberculatus]